MLVDLTAAQSVAVTQALTACGYGWAAERWLPTWKTRPSRVVMVECLMPAIGWEQALTCLVEVSVGPRGGNRKDAPTHMLNARQRIAHALATYGAHPALYGIGLPGVHADVFPVWLQPSARGGYSIFPSGLEFVHLVPENDGTYTIWKSTPARWVADRPTVLNPQEHLHFQRGSTPTSTEVQG